LLYEPAEDAVPVKLSRSLDRRDEWVVSRNETVIVCFSCPSALEQAVRRSHELAALLDDTVDQETLTDPDTTVIATRK
jgi:hypothetical protein